ncbi:Ger(x)C family spore germination protein [Neobacillus pocheonensis]|uniref:Ger(x)C family spore germination protein n=1 Tax=Neobacillus pocheonensis TaxID=363869 RepID=UPI003D2AC9F6
MRKLWIVSIFSCCLVLNGCSGMKNIQDLTYIVGLGMDYDVEKEEYTAYLQALNFASVAKTEGGRPTEPIPIFVASAKGETLNLAVSQLYKKSEPPLFFGHTVTLVLSENMIADHIDKVIEEVGRNRSLRHTLRVVTTKENIKNVFKTKALFEYPAVYTILYKKSGNELYQDAIKPMTLMQFLRDFYEPMGAAKIPIVKIDKGSWTAGKKYPILYFDGYMIFQQQKFIKEFKFKDAVFMNWLLEKNVSFTQKVQDEGKLVSALKLASPKMKVKYKKGSAVPKFSIEISVQADLLEKVEDIPLMRLKKLVNKEIEKKVTSLYNNGVENETDLLNIGDKWYRKHPKYYRNLQKTNNFYLNKDSLTNVKVDVQIFHYNAYKYFQKSDF